MPIRAGHIGLVQGVPTPCLLEATGREASGLGGIVRLFVDPGFMRKGLARALLGAAAGYARTCGLQPVLDVVAVALYEGSGWKLAGTKTATWVTSSGVSPTLRCYFAPQASRRAGRADQPFRRRHF
jgi:GNAT superfamily N-acetyltransferase